MKIFKKVLPILALGALLVTSIVPSKIFAETENKNLCVNPKKISTSSSYGDRVASRAIDGLNTDYFSNAWEATSWTGKGEWIMYDFENQTIINNYSISASNFYQTAPKDWIFQGSNDASTWTNLDSVTNQKFKPFEKKEFSFENKSSFRYYRIFVTNIDVNVSTYLIIGELEMGSSTAAVPTGVVLNIEPDKTKIKTTEKVVANLTIDNIKEIAAEDIRVKYDAQKLKYDGATEVDGFKLVKNDEKAGELRFIVASKGNANIVSSKKTLLQLGFTGIAPGEAKVDVIKGRVSDGIEMEKDLTDEQCGEATILIEKGTMLDVNNSGAFTLLDLAIDARHLNKDPKSEELKKYNTDIVLDNAINDNDLSEIGRLMLENPDYKF